MAVVLDTEDSTCRSRNAARDRPVPAPVLAAQLKRHAEHVALLDGEGWDVVETVTGGRAGPSDRAERARATPGPERRNSQGLKVVLQLSRFPWGDEPLPGWPGWLARPTTSVSAACR